VPCEKLEKVSHGEPNLLQRIYSGDVSLMVNTPTPGANSADSLRIRRACIETGVACLTSIDTAGALVKALGHFADPMAAECRSIAEYVQGKVN
jgi:carbamoyl-phosphate synthase large subunit